MKYDVVIIGGGPAGMMAAGAAGGLGAKVLLLEKGSGLGAKLLMTGGGRCNITNAAVDLKEMAACYGAVSDGSERSARFMRRLLYAYGPNEAVAFFNEHGVKTRVEEHGRVMPVDNDAGGVLDALVACMREGGVEVRLGAQVREIVRNGNCIESVVLADGEQVKARSFLIATGGKSYPATGSTGDGYKFAKALGHSIVTPRPALTSIIVKDDFASELEGLSLQGVRVHLYKDNKKISKERGDVIFTSQGLSGPVIMDMSKTVGSALAGSVELRLDLLPDVERKALEQMLLKGFTQDARRLFKNSMEGLLPQRLLLVVAGLAGIEADKKAGEVTREQRKMLVGLLKEFPLRVRKVAGFERAFVTAGGVELSEVDPETMRSKIIDNLYFAGEALDIDGPTGGYNLQVCWSTGYVAGSAMANK